MEVLQQGFPGMLATMSDPHSPASGHDPVPRHDHDHDHDHEHSHGSDSGVLSRLRHILRPHSHGASDQIDAAMETSKEGMRTLWISLAVLGGLSAHAGAKGTFRDPGGPDQRLLVPSACSNARRDRVSRSMTSWWSLRALSNHVW